ncbi:MAG: nitrogenase cofactor biosynthesis protein NifB [bacterium]
MDLNRHPCYQVEAKGRFGRVHLPIAPKCNIQCNYCNRQYDCVNESRPGVTSTVLSPGQALRYVEQVLEREPRITVAGIAGPGDPLANAETTMETLSLIRQKFPKLILCLATNGLGLPPYLDRLAELKVSHVTVTINAVDPDVGEKMYAWVRDGRAVYRGGAAAELLLNRQIESIYGLKMRGFLVKVNCIVVPGENDHHVAEVARRMSELGVDIFNCMPVYPSPDTPFADITEPSEEMMSTLRQQAAQYIPQLYHCTRCRADAVGLLNEDRTQELRDCLTACSALPLNPDEDRPYVAVASREGTLVNLHLGEAAQFMIFGQAGKGFSLMETRPGPQPGSGQARWQALVHTLRDCRAVLVSGIGESPKTVLEKAGIRPVEMYGFIEQGLEAVFHNGDLRGLKARRISCTRAAGCSKSGSGAGCCG